MYAENQQKVEEKYLVCLDSLRSSGVTNMFGAVPYLMEKFPELTRREATDILVSWMETFEDRHPEEE